MEDVNVSNDENGNAPLAKSNPTISEIKKPKSKVKKFFTKFHIKKNKNKLISES